MIKKILSVTLSVLCVVGCTTAKTDKSSIGFIELQTELRENPEGISAEKPRFSWKLSSNKQDVVQTAYKVEVASSEKDLKEGKNLVWNSEKVASEQSLFIKYAGNQLEKGKKYFWQVTVWTNKGDESRSAIQHFSTAIDGSPDWAAAKWIGINDAMKVEDNRTILPARYLRREFEVGNGKILRAALYISGVGSSVPYINGKQVGNDVFGP
ncbi:MAG: alpha-rhamnosidase, partial [Dysgonamonadaceae bacterium]|nr:alpha-rhamnosidase [Dysgonamonadaceae bacterium]